MLLPKYALCNEVSEVDILHLKVLFCTGGEGTRIKLLHLFFLSVLDSSSPVLQKNTVSSTV